MEFLERYRQLIALPTISSLDASEDLSNKTLIELLANWLSDLGFKTEILPVEGARQKYNLLATYGEGDGGLLLAGHTDTVPFDEGRWTFDPFTLTEQAGKLYGLGTADMKGLAPVLLHNTVRFVLIVPLLVNQLRSCQSVRIKATWAKRFVLLGKAATLAILIEASTRLN